MTMNYRDNPPLTGGLSEAAVIEDEDELTDELDDDDDDTAEGDET